MDVPERRNFVQKTLQGHAKRIAETYRANKAEWRKAAEDLRQPSGIGP